MKTIEFVFVPDRVPVLRKAHCRALNILDGMAQRIGASTPLPGEDLGVKQACLQFIHFKDILDMTLDGADGYRSIFKFTKPFEYLTYMLPGVQFTFGERASSEEVDPEAVIGCSWQQHPPPADPKAVMEKLNSGRPGNMERASYSRVCDLPLFIAGEGKNRVELFRRHKRKIVADVQQMSPSKFPVINRDRTGKRWLASWKNKHGAHILAAVPFPSISLPIYRLLGIEVRSERIPVNEAELEKSLSATIRGLTEAVAVP